MDIPLIGNLFLTKEQRLERTKNELAARLAKKRKIEGLETEIAKLRKELGKE